MKRIGMMPLNYDFDQFDNNYYDEVGRSPSIKTTTKGRVLSSADSKESSDFDMTRSDISSPARVARK